MMFDMFKCKKCGHVDALEFAYPNGNQPSPQEMECTQCQTGAWHNLITRRSPRVGELLINQPTGLGLGGL